MSTQIDAVQPGLLQPYPARSACRRACPVGMTPAGRAALRLLVQLLAARRPKG